MSWSRRTDKIKKKIKENNTEYLSLKNKIN